MHIAVGTLRYMAPEILEQDALKAITDKVDLYSLGMVMWEMVAGEAPWRGLTDPQIMTAVSCGHTHIHIHTHIRTHAPTRTVERTHGPTNHACGE